MDIPACWYEDELWRGNVLIPTMKELLVDHVILAWVSGFDRHEDEARGDDFAPGARLSLLPEPDDPYPLRSQG